MKIKLGYSTGGPLATADHPIKDQVKLIAEVEKEAIEIWYGAAEELNDKIDQQTAKLIRQFKYISIHAPVTKSYFPKVKEADLVRYPSQESHLMVKEIKDIAQKIKAQTIVFHPDLVDDFAWLGNIFKDKLAFENLSYKIKFGRTVEDLVWAFQQAPQAKFVLDLAHVYTNDPTMKLAKKFHQALGHRLCHYHLSGYEDGHNCLCLTKQDVILKGLKDLSVPILMEGSTTREGKKLLLKEHQYLLETLEKAKSFSMIK